MFLLHVLLPFLWRIKIIIIVIILLLQPFYCHILSPVYLLIAVNIYGLHPFLLRVGYVATGYRKERCFLTVE